MITAIIDTHAVIWHIHNNPRLSTNALNFIRAAASNSLHIGISSITLVEMVYLIEKGRIPAESFSRLTQAFTNPYAVFMEVPLNLDIARTLSRVDVAKVPDMPDRIIAATALHWNVPVISKDGKIQLSGLKTIW